MSFRFNLLLLVLFVLLYSCTEKQDKMLVSTPYFDSVVKRSDRVYDAGNKTEALNLLIAAHTNAKDLSIEDEMNYYTYCGETYRKDLKDNDKYIAYADSMIQLLEKNNLVKKLSNRYIQACNMKADALFSKGLYNESYEYYYDAKKLAGDNHDTCSLSQFSYSLGMVLYREQRYLDAASDFIAAYNESSKCKDMFIFFYRRQELLDNIGLCYYHAQKYDSAMLFYSKALAYIDSNYGRFDKPESVYISAKAVVYGNMADLYIVLKNYDTAKALLKKSIAINLQKGYTNSDAVLDQVKLGSLYYNIGSIADMKDLLQDIKAELDTIPDKGVELSLNKLMWEYYDHEKDSATAYQYLKAYEMMSDSLAANNKSLMASDVDGRIKNLERQYQITLLNKNTYEEKIYLIVASLIALMAIVIVILVLRNMKRSRENIIALTELNKQVNEQKEKLQTALTELEVKDRDKSRVLRAAAHDVLNPIAAISGLTDILKMDSDNFTGEQKEILSLIKESCENSIGLSKDILEAATPTDKRNLVKEWVNINKLLANSIDLLSARAAAKQQRLFFTANIENIKAHVHKEKIWRVVNNLIGNAIKFSYEHSTIESGLQLTSGNVVISVKDKGMGIAEDKKPFIFDVFSDAKMYGTSDEIPQGLWPFLFPCR